MIICNGCLRCVLVEGESEASLSPGKDEGGRELASSLFCFLYIDSWRYCFCFHCPFRLDVFTKKKKKVCFRKKKKKFRLYQEGRIAQLFCYKTHSKIELVSK